MAGFDKWFLTFIEEKEIDDSRVFEFINKAGVWNYIPIEVVFKYILSESKENKAKIKNTLVKIDFANGNVYHFFEYIAKYLGGC